MVLNRKFWVSITVFQIVFGLSVFTITRQYYLVDSDGISTHSVKEQQQALAWPNGVEDMFSTPITSIYSQPSIEDPVEIARQAGVYFSQKQYARAADLYQRLLSFAPNNVETYNNLGITLHYLGKPTEALSLLREGVSLDPSHQRIWLTLGFVNSQTGNTEKARSALSTAVSINADSEIGISAASMLENLN